MSINHTRTLNIRHFHQRTKNISSHCDKSRNILSQKQLCHSSLKQNYIHCTMYHISNRFLWCCFISLNSEDENTALYFNAILKFDFIMTIVVAEHIFS